MFKWVDFFWQKNCQNHFGHHQNRLKIHIRGCNLLICFFFIRFVLSRPYLIVLICVCHKNVTQLDTFLNKLCYTIVKMKRITYDISSIKYVRRHPADQEQTNRTLALFLSMRIQLGPSYTEKSGLRQWCIIFSLHILLLKGPQKNT